MARFDQYIGLNEWASKFVDRPNVKKKKSDRTFFGMFGDSYPLFEYTFPDGRSYFEHVQADPWSSGPMFFIALKNKKGNWIPRSLWSREVIENS